MGLDDGQTPSGYYSSPVPLIIMTGFLITGLIIALIYM